MIGLSQLGSDNLYRGKRVLVTGASGFLGRHIVRRLASSDAQVFAGVRHTCARADQSLALDITDTSSVEDALKLVRPTHIINCAAYGVDQRRQDYAAAFAVNVKGATDLVKAAANAGASRVIHIGTCSEYASSDNPIPEDAPQRPHNLYALSKAAGTLAALEAGARVGIDVVVLRPFGLWGPGEPDFRIIPQVVAACQTRVPLALTECDVVRDYSFVADAADWIVRAALADSVAHGTIVNIGTGRPVLLRDFVTAVASRLGGLELMELGKRPQRPNEPKSVVANVMRLERLIGSLMRTSLDDGLHAVLNERPR